MFPARNARPASRDRQTDPDTFAAGQRTLFDEMNLHVGKSRVVHRVAWLAWINDLTLPAPACRQGFAGHGCHAELRPTRWPVTCRRCRRMAGERAPDAGPLPLF